MSVTVDTRTHREIQELLREMQRVSRELATYSLTVELAAARRDHMTMYDAAEVVKALAARAEEIHLKLLIKGVR